MKTVLLLLLISVFSVSYSIGQNVDWLMGDGGQTNPPSKDIGAICRDKAGHLFIAGAFSNSFKIGNSTLLNTRGLSDVYLISVNTDSTINWTKHIGGAGSENFDGALSSDPAGNIYIAGSFGDSLWVDGQYLLHTGNPAPGFRSDVFVAKFNPAGTLMWLKQTKGYDIETATDVAADEAGNVYLSGQFEHDTDFGDNLFVNNTGEDDAFLCKYDSSGNLVWKKICQSSYWSHEEISFIEASPDGHIYVTGFYHDSTTTFDGLPLPLTSVAGQSFIVSISPSGSVSWIRYLQNFSGGGTVKGLELRDSSLYVAGNFTGVLSINPFLVVSSGGQDVFLAALSLDSAQAHWARSYGNNGTNTMARHGLEAAPNGRLYITGDFADSTRFDSLTLTATIGRDIYAAICDSIGNVLYLHAATANGDQLAGAIAGDSIGNIYLSGISLSGNINFGTRSLAAPFGGTFLTKFTPFVIPVTGIKELSEQKIHVFPNPVTREVSWSSTPGMKVQSYKLYDIRGVAVLQSNGMPAGRLDVAHLPAGSYILQLNTSDGLANLKLMKQ